MSQKKDINLNIECERLTSKALAEVVNNILQFLLHIRQQIPLAYNIFDHYVKSWKEEKDAALGDHEKVKLDSYMSFFVEKQREEASYTRYTISAMKSMITNLFDKNNIVYLRFLFGSTSFTAREAYTIHFPMDKTMKKHTYENHHIPFSSINKIILKLLEEKELLPTSQIPPAYVFLEVETIDKHNASPEYYKETKPFLLPKQKSQLPPHCADIHIYLSQAYPENFDHNLLQENCCRDIQIFQDLSELEDDDDDKPINIDPIFENFSELKINDDKISDDPEPLSLFWESEIVVHGFKEKYCPELNMWWS